MKQLAKEIYDPSIHFWYAYDLMTEHAYGQIFNSSEDTIGSLVQTIHEDLEETLGQEGHYWYFGNTLEEIVLMIRFLDGQYEIQVNLKDFDFALHLDAIINWKETLLKSLGQ